MFPNFILPDHDRAGSDDDDDDDGYYPAWITPRDTKAIYETRKERGGEVAEAGEGGS